jgi:hypothetical protein
VFASEELFGAGMQLSGEHLPSLHKALDFIPAPPRPLSPQKRAGFLCKKLGSLGASSPVGFAPFRNKDLITKR